ncbi:MAG: ABC transporter ATP-binding protein [Planctomycetota bacterium]
MSVAGPTEAAAETAGETAASSDRPPLEVRGLTRKFGKLVAANTVSFSVGRGEVMGFVGPNGAGKTTTMRIVATLDLPDAGDAFVCGHSVVDHPDRVRRQLGFMPDAFGKYPNMDVTEYLDFFARAYGLKGADRRDALDRVLVFTELRKIARKPIDKLSKGMSQRLGLGRILVHDPQVLILDEPAAGLDPRARVELRELIRLLADEMGKTVLISSHILTELTEICDAAAIIEAGRILAHGHVDDLVQKVREGRGTTKSTASVITVRLAGGEDAVEAAARWLAEQPHVSAIERAPGRVEFHYDPEESRRADLLAAMLAAGHRVADFHGRTETLEDAFMAITEGIVQ